MAGRRLNSREMSVLKKEAAKKRVSAKAFLVDVSQSPGFARSGVAESPTWARSTRMAAVMPYKPLGSAQIMNPNMGLVLWQTYSCLQVFEWDCLRACSPVAMCSTKVIFSVINSSCLSL